MFTIRIGLCFLLLFSALVKAEQSRPNFIIIFTDDQGYEDVGCFGSKLIKTPCLDRMADEGMRFTNFYAQPYCGPSRTALMTGCYPGRVAEQGHSKNLHPILHSEEVTLAEVLKDNGYATACFGKWGLANHLQPPEEVITELMPTRQGFDYFFGTSGSNDRIVNLYRNEKLIELETDMSLLTRRHTDEAIGYIQKNKGAPFFVYVPYSMPHVRLEASEAFLGKSARGLFGDVIEEIDYNIGRILDTIRSLGLENHTYVLFTSDNGPWLSKNTDHVDGHLPEHHGGSAGPLRSGKVSSYEGGFRVPAIVWAPGNIPAGKVCDNMASTLDVLPTFANLADAAIPNDRVIDGEDIRHLLQGKFKQANDNKIFYYYLRNRLEAVRQGKWKVHLPRDGEILGRKTINNHIAPADRIVFQNPFLVNLEEDIGETTDLSTQYPEVVEKLLKLAEEARMDIGDFDRIGDNQRFFGHEDGRPDKQTLVWMSKKNNK